MRILIIEDSHDIAANIGDFLIIHKHDVDFAYDGELGLNLATNHTFDMIILDINLPKIDGFSLCKKLRDEYQLNIPILMLTARGSLADKVTGFNVGAWDYLVKPFALEELGLRINALVLRQKVNQPQLITIDDLTLDISNHQVIRNKQNIPMHKACILILELLMRSSPNIVSRQDLTYLLWGDNPPDSNPLRTHIHEIRSQLDKPFAYPMLRTVRGKGYQIVSKHKTKLRTITDEKK